MNEKNAHPNRSWRKTWRIQPDDVETAWASGSFDWKVELENYMRQRGWDRNQLAEALCEDREIISKWVLGIETPPFYLMLALSALD